MPYVNELKEQSPLSVEALRDALGVVAVEDRLEEVENRSTSIDLQTTDTHIQWKTGDSETWTDLIARAELEGRDGDQVEMDKSATHLRWRLVGSESWTDLVALDSLRGEPGKSAYELAVEDGFEGSRAEWRVSLRGQRGLPGPASSAYFGGTFDGGNVDIAPGAYCDVYIPWGCEIIKASLLGNAVGELVVDVRTVPFAAYPPSNVDSIVAANPLRLVTSNKWEDTVLEGWNKTLETGAVVRFHVISCTGVSRAQVSLEGIRL